MARAGVLALEFFTPGKGLAGWGQAHMMARYAILQVMLEAGQGLVRIMRGEADQQGGKGTVVILDRTKVRACVRARIHMRVRVCVLCVSLPGWLSISGDEIHQLPRTCARLLGCDRSKLSGWTASGSSCASSKCTNQRPVCPKI